MTHGQRGPAGPSQPGARRGGGGPQGGDRPSGAGLGIPEFPVPSPTELSAIIEAGDPKQLVEVAQRIGQALARERLTTSQIRAIFGIVRQIEMSWPVTGATTSHVDPHRELLLLHPKLAYQAKRTGASVEHLRQVLDPAIDLIGDDRDHFQNFADFFEAILAYHRFFFEGRDS